MENIQAVYETLKKYDIKEGEATKKERMYSLLSGWCKEIGTSYSNLAIRCGGIHARIFMDDFGAIIRPKYLIDKNIENISNKLESYQMRYLDSYFSEVDAVIICTYDYRKVVIEELISQGCPKEIIFDPYDFLEKNGIVLDSEYWHLFEEPYKKIISDNISYKNEASQGKRQELLYSLICQYLDIKDFFSAFNYIDEYVKCEYRDWEKLVSLKKELERCLLNIKNKLDNRKQKDIIWFWQDGMPSFILKELPFIKSQCEDGLVFEEAYTPSPVTRSIYGRILNHIEEYDYYSGSYKPADNYFCKELEKQGYEAIKVNKPGLDDIKLNKYDYRNAAGLISNSALTELYWKALILILNSQKPLCVLIHSGIETHDPCISPALDYYEILNNVNKVDRFSKEGRNRYLDRLCKNSKYVDSQLKYFSSFFGKNTFKIYMSDHGDILTSDSYFFTKDSAKEILIVTGEVPSKTYDRLFCITDFSYLIKYLLNQSAENEQKMFSEEIWLNGVDAYNETYIKDIISANNAKYGVAYDGIQTFHDRYVMLATGEEFYNVFPDDYKNEINNDKYQNRVYELREKMKKRGYKFIDICETTKFSHSHLIYEALGKERRW